ncbi:hypothetical protein M1247_02420 [Mycobacterium sp. 21AC1]|uniref:hypothetical protein n=1 Tax=[Mycobacterium] appelbergii TaxID=2939269 RepID=UPI00293926F8|nr:hypothetical protein [Mycobacterium sp. 21AC1]MDV3123760.1 hypothetical protein [Mycobacterium sp. 21AC1]
MRVAVTMALAGLLLASAPIASADPVEPPEVAWDPARTVFIDNPAIVDPHATRIESVVRGPDKLWVNFTAGTPDCFGVHVTATETPQSVTVELRGGTPPEAVGRMCIALAVAGTVDVPLQAPPGDRTVLVQA